MRNILFIAPRFHSNQFFSIEALISDEIKVSFFVFYIGKNEAYPKGVNVIKMPISRLFSFYKWFFIGKAKKNDPDYERYLIRNYAIPSLFFLIKNYIGKFDLVVIRNIGPNYSILCSIFARLSNIKIVYYTQLAFKNDYSKWRLLLYKVYFKLFGASHYTPILKVVDNPKFSLARTTYLPFANHVKKVTRDRSNCTSILFIGKFVERKRLLFLIETMLEYDLFKYATLTVVGEAVNNSDMDLLKRVKKYILDNNLSEKVSIHVNVNFLEMQKYYMNSNILVLPAVREPASVSIVEAMSFGVIPVCTEQCGTKCYIENKVNGIIFNSKSKESLALSLAFLVEDSQRIETMSLNCYRTIEQNHNPLVFSNYIKSLLYD